MIKKFLTFAFLSLAMFSHAAADDIPRPRAIPPVEIAELDRSLLRGLDFLLTHQRKNGSFGSPLNTKKLNIYAPGTSHEGFHAGTNALCLSALIEMETWLKTLPENPETEEQKAFLARRQRLTESIARCEEWTLENLPRLRRSAPTALYNVWGHAYGIQSLCRMAGRTPPGLSEDEIAVRREKILEEIRHQVELLRRFECLNGGWCYYNFGFPTQVNSGSPLSFVTATIFIALDEARALGVDIPEHLITRGTASILRQRRPNNAYCYGEYLVKDAREINLPAGSLSRSLVCTLALSRWGEHDFITQQLFTDSLDRFIARIGWNDIGRKRPVPHEAWFQVAGYFYYYGHYYAAGCMEKLEDPALRKKYANHLADILLGLQEPDGSWWDFPLYDYHPYYGTGMAVTVLLKCRKEF